MRACVEILLKHGHVPIITVKNMDTMGECEYNVNKSKMLNENWATMPYTKLSFIMKDNEEAKEYSSINLPKCTI
jgi:hypothetical protein